MKIIVCFNTTAYFKAEEKEKAEAFVKDISANVLEKGMNVEVAWDTDHVRVTGRQEFGDEE